MKNLSGSWKHKPPIFYVVIVFCLGIMLIAVIRNILPWSNWIMDVAFGVFVLVCLAVCLYIFRDWHTDGKERNILFQRQLDQPLPLQSLPATKIEEQKQIARQRHPVKQLPPMGHKRPFATISASARPVSAHATSSPQAMRTPSGRTDGQDIADRRTAHVGQLTDGRILDADTQADADKSRVLVYKQHYPAASVREVANGVGMGKTKAAEIIQQLKREGKLQ